MPNINKPYGFRPLRYLNGAAWNGATNMYVVLQAEANQINPGDLVKSVAGGDANGLPAVTKITNGTDVPRGVVVGVLPVGPNVPSLQGVTIDLTTQSIPATKTKDYYILVMDDPNVLCALQDDGLAALTATSANKNTTYTVTNPTAPSQNSASVLKTAGVAVTATLPLKIMGLVQSPDNAFGAYADWVVFFNLHELRGNTAGL